MSTNAFIMKRILSLLLCLFSPLPVLAHEFWAMAQPFHPAANEPVSVRFHVGEQFKGDVVPLSRPQAAMLTLFNGTESFDMRPQLPVDRTLPELQFALPAKGSWLLAYDSHPNAITMQAEKFHAYLHDEGLDHVIRQREAAGKEREPARELFRRNVKVLMRAGSRSSAAFAVRTRQRFEILPQQDPQALRPGGKLDLAVYFDGKPANGVLLKAWHQRERELLTIRATTDASGKAVVHLPYAGTWMLSAVYMVAASSREADWESYWANLTFALPAE
jgi:hypothetical protein